LTNSKPDLTTALKQAIELSGLTHYAIAQRAGISESSLCRFATGERDITLDTASKLATALGAELRTKKARR